MSDIMMSYRVDSQAYNIINGNFSTYREERDVKGGYSTINAGQKPKEKSAAKSTKKKLSSSKTPTTNKTRKITQKENREVNTTDKGL